MKILKRVLIITVLSTGILLLGFSAKTLALCSTVGTVCNNTWNTGQTCDVCNGGYSGGCNCAAGRMQWCCSSWTRHRVSICTVNMSCTFQDNRSCTVVTSTLLGSCYNLSQTCSCCTPATSCACAPYASSNQGAGIRNVSCPNGCGGTASSTCYCYACTPPSCPAPLTASAPVPNDPNMILSNFTSCTNDCNNTRNRSCYEVPSDQPEESIDIQENLLNTYGFSSLTHSGIPGSAAGDLNDPITMTATYRDPDAASEIEGIFVWFRDDTSVGEPGTPLYISTTATPQAPSQGSWGFMMRKEGSNWFPYVPSYAVNPTVWTRAVYNSTTGRFVISGTSGGNMVGVTVRPSDIVTNTVEKTVSMTFRLKFSTDSTVTIVQPVSQIKYKILLMGLDTFSFTPNDNYESVAAIRDRIDSYWAPNQLRYRTSPTTAQLYARDWENPNNLDTGSNATWTIDKVAPQFQSVVTPTASENNINISWSVSDDQNLYEIVGNIYTTAGPDARDITLSTSTPGVVLKTPNTFTPEAEDPLNTGRINGDISFRVGPDMATTTNAGTVSIDIGANRTGTLIFYLTVFDDAGNMAIVNYSYNLNDWFVTDGGLAYSRDGTSFVRNSPESSWVGKLPPFTSFSTESLTYLKGDLSSEMWAEDTVGIPTALDNFSSSVDSYSIRNHGGSSITSFYETLYEAYEFKETFIPSPVYRSFMTNYIINDVQIKTPLCNDSSSYCILDFQQNLTINPGLACNSRALIFVRGNLTLSPPLRNIYPPAGNAAASNSEGCIFVVGGDLNILEGTGMSGATMVYDLIHGYFVVDGEIRINSEALADGEGGTKSPSAIFDGVYINGGIQSLEGVYIGRYLRLIDRQIYPVVTIDHHPKYGVLSGVFFGSNFSFQKIEPGFKP